MGATRGKRGQKGEGIAISEAKGSKWRLTWEKKTVCKCARHY